MNKPLNCSNIGRDYLRVYSDKALKGEVLVSYQFQLRSKWRIQNSSDEKENDYSEKILESVYLFPDDAARLLRYSVVNSKRFTKPKDFTFGNWFGNNSNPLLWIEVEQTQRIQLHNCLLYIHPNFEKTDGQDPINKEKEKINPRERDSYLKLIAILSHHLAPKLNNNCYVKNNGSLNVDPFAEWLSNRWKEIVPRDSDNMSKSNIRKKLSLALNFLNEPSQVTDKS